MDHQAKTNAVYNTHALHFDDTFSNDGARTKDIDRAFRLAGNPSHARAVEIGCGNGRDAVEIIKHTAWFEGFDPASDLLQVAVKNVPEASFVVADAVSYDYPQDLDVVFAFASLLHVDRHTMPVVFRKVAGALKSGGVFDIRLRERDQYGEELQKDEYGERMFYYYNLDMLKDFAGGVFELSYVDHDHDDKRSITWFGVDFRKL